MPDKTSSLAKKQLISIKEEDDTWIHNRDCIVTHCVDLYQELYRSRRLPTDTTEPQQPHRPGMDSTASAILPIDVEALIKKLDCSKAPGKDNITGSVLQGSGETNLINWLFNKCLQLCQALKAWQSAVMVLLCKKGNTSDIKNYRPISLLPIIYKVFSHILLQHILWTVDFNKPSEMAGFRSGFSTTDHLHVINQVQEKAHEYSIPLCFALVDH